LEAPRKVIGFYAAAAASSSFWMEKNCIRAWSSQSYPWKK